MHQIVRQGQNRIHAWIKCIACHSNIPIFVPVIIDLLYFNGDE
jgi:hypothetical protein